MGSSLRLHLLQLLRYFDSYGYRRFWFHLLLPSLLNYLATEHTCVRHLLLDLLPRLVAEISSQLEVQRVLVWYSRWRRSLCFLVTLFVDCCRQQLDMPPLQNDITQLHSHPVHWHWIHYSHPPDAMEIHQRTMEIEI